MLQWQFIALTLLHIFYAIFSTLWALVCAVLTSKAQTPKALLHPRAQKPQHLAIAFLAGNNTNRLDDDALLNCILESAKSSIQWSASIGVRTLTLYDRHNMLKEYASELEHELSLSTLLRSEAIYPPARHSLRRRGKSQATSFYPTPPTTDDYVSSTPCTEDDTFSEVDSNSTAPKRISILSFNFLAPPFQHIPSEESSDDESVPSRLDPKSSSSNSMKIYIVSYSDGTPAIAKAAQALTSRPCALISERHARGIPFSVADLDQLLSAELPSPQFLITHDMEPPCLLPSSERPLQLDAFPPWHLRLTEFHRTSRKWGVSSIWGLASAEHRRYNILSQVAFRQALDDYEKAEMREGK